MGVRAASGSVDVGAASGSVHVRAASGSVGVRTASRSAKAACKLMNNSRSFLSVHGLCMCMCVECARCANMFSNNVETE